MKKQDLKTGMVVEYRDKTLRLVVGSGLYDECGYKVSSLEGYNDELSQNNRLHVQLDIVAVYNDFDKSKCLWKRVEFKKDQLKNGAVVKTRQGKYYLKVDDTLIDLKYGTYLSFTEYDDDLKHNSDSCFAIVEIDNSEIKENEAYLHYISGNESNFIKINED